MVCFTVSNAFAKSCDDDGGEYLNTTTNKCVSCAAEDGFASTYVGFACPGEPDYKIQACAENEIPEFEYGTACRSTYSTAVSMSELAAGKYITPNGSVADCSQAAYEYLFGPTPSSQSKRYYYFYGLDGRPYNDPGKSDVGCLGKKNILYMPPAASWHHPYYAKGLTRCPKNYYAYSNLDYKICEPTGTTAWQNNTYTCSAGQYIPKGYRSCQSCESIPASSPYGCAQSFSTGKSSINEYDGASSDIFASGANRCAEGYKWKNKYRKLCIKCAEGYSYNNSYVCSHETPDSDAGTIGGIGNIGNIGNISIGAIPVTSGTTKFWCDNSSNSTINWSNSSLTFPSISSKCSTPSTDNRTLWMCLKGFSGNNGEQYFIWKTYKQSTSASSDDLAGLAGANCAPAMPIKVYWPTQNDTPVEFYAVYAAQSDVLAVVSKVDNNTYWGGGQLVNGVSTNWYAASTIVDYVNSFSGSFDVTRIKANPRTESHTIPTTNVTSFTNALKDLYQYLGTVWEISLRVGPKMSITCPDNTTKSVVYTKTTINQTDIDNLLAQCTTTYSGNNEQLLCHDGNSSNYAQVSGDNSLCFWPTAIRSVSNNNGFYCETYACKTNLTRCGAGMYLPADGTTCTPCPAVSSGQGYYCLGGDFDGITDQGLSNCPSGYPWSAQGNSSIETCYITMSFYPGKNAVFRTATYSSDESHNDLSNVYKQSNYWFDLVSNTDGTKHMAATLLAGGNTAPERTGYTFDGWMWQKQNVDPSECTAAGMTSPCANASTCGNTNKRGCNLGDLTSCPSGWSYYGGLCIPNSKLTAVTASTSIISGSQRNFYAKWTGNPHTITYKCNENEEPKQTVNVRYGDVYTWKTPASVCGETGYTVGSSFSCTSGGATVSNSATWSVTGDAVCTTTKTLNRVTITLDKNGGTGKCGTQTGTTPGSMVCEYNGNCVLPEWDSDTCNITNSDDDTKILIGWGADASEPDSIYGLGKDIKNYVKTLTASTSATMTLYAQWMAPDCAVEQYNMAGDISATVAAAVAVDNIPHCTYTCKVGYSTDGYTNDIPAGNKFTKAAVVYQTFDTQDAYKVSNTTVGSVDKCLGRTYHVHLNPGTGATETALDYYYVYNTPKNISGNDYYFWKKEITGVGDMIVANLSTNYRVYADKPGFKFGGYWSREDVGGTKYISEFEGPDAGKRVDYIYKKEPTENTASNVVNLYARWAKETYKITLNPNGGVLGTGVANEISYSVDSNAFNLPDTSNITRAGYDFSGWCLYDVEQEVVTTAANCSQTVTSFTPSPTNIGNKYAYAKWTATKYTITYHTDGGTINTTGVEAVPTENDTYTQQYTVESGSVALALPTRGENYQFDGWYEDGERVGGMENKITAGLSSTEYNRDIILYAKWLKKCKAGTYLQHDSENCVPCEEDYYCAGDKFYPFPSGEDQGLTSCADATSGIYKHSEAATDAENNDKGVAITNCYALVEFDGNGGLLPNNNDAGITSKAYYQEPDGKSCQWTGDGYDASSNLNYLCLSGKTGYKLKSAVADSNGNFYGVPFHKAGYDFAGYYLEKTPSTADTLVTSGRSLNDDETLYAQWKLTEYSIKYYDVLVADETNPGAPVERSVPDDRMRTTYTIETEFDFVPPTKPENDNGLGWEFKGWYDNQGLTGAEITAFEPDLNNLINNKPYYAKWTPEIGYVDFYCDPTTPKERSGQVGSYMDVETCDSGEVLGWSCSGDPWFEDNYTKLVVPKGRTVCRPGYMITYKGKGIENNTMVEVNPHVKLAPSSYTSDLEVVFPSKKFMNNFKLRPGYLFTGWFYNYNSEPETFSNKTTGLPRGSSGHKTVYAQWSPNNYRVTYNCDSTTEGSVTPSSVSVTYDDEQFKTAENTCVKTGYDFAGWIVSGTDGDIKPANATFQWKYDEDKTFIAKWNPITISCVGGKYVAAGAETCDQDCETGYYCPGGNYEYSDGVQGRKTCPQGFGHSYAKSDEITDCWAKLTIHGNGGKNTLDPSTETNEVLAYYDKSNNNCDYNNGEKYLCTSNTTSYKLTNDFATNGEPYSKMSYAFVGWYGNAAGTGDQISVSTDLIGDQDIYAKWEVRTYDVSYVCGADATGTPPTHGTNGKHVFGTTFDWANNTDANCAKVGHHFNGWLCTYDDVNNTPLTNGAIYNQPYSATCVAQWEPEAYNITYFVHYYDDRAWQDKYLLPTSYTIGVETQLATPYTQEGYEFKGWCRVSALEHPDCVPITTSTFTPTEDDINGISLYAKWSYGITYVLNGGTSVAGPEAYDSGVVIEESSLPRPTRAGYTFMGWYDLSGNKVESVPVDTEWRPVTLVAGWEFNCASGKWMHVGDGENDKMCLSHDRPEGTVLGVMVDNTPYYVRLSESGDNSKTINNNSTTKLHVQIGETIYNAHDASIE